MAIRKAVAILLVRHDKKFLLMHRDDEGSHRFPGYWGFFGGGVEDGQTPEQALLQEAKEELGIDLVRYHLALVHDFSDVHDAIGKKWVFIAPFEKQEAITQGEGQGMGWFSIAELDNLKIIPHDKEAIVKIMQKNGA